MIPDHFPKTAVGEESFGQSPCPVVSHPVTAACERERVSILVVNEREGKTKAVMKKEKDNEKKGEEKKREKRRNEKEKRKKKN